ncbi:hypothetical protein JCM8547_003611 [Rhodosporidiobolus lusitaniae]
MDIDDIFKRPPLPKSSLTNPNKRKLDVPPTLDADSYKSVRLDTPSGPAATARGGGVTIEDVADEDGPSRGGEFAPDQDADYFEEEDEDGRFYGGGLSTTQKQVLNIMEGKQGAEEGVDVLPGEDLTPQSVRKQLLNLEKAVNKNRDLRTRYPTEPEKFVDSEFNLLEALHALLLLSTSPALTYPLLLENATTGTLADLLSHENTDVPIAIVEVLEEWVDPEGLEDDDADEGEEAQEKKREAVKALVDGLVKEGVVELVVSQLDRLNEEDEGERTGVFHTLSLIENLLTLSPALATPFLSPKSKFLAWLLTRLSKSSASVEYDQNRFYAAEMLALVLSLPAEVVEDVNEARMRIGEEDGVDALLKVLSVYRKRDPSSGDEIEFMENVFDALCSCLSSPVPPRVNTSTLKPVPHPVKAAFLDGEGVELLVLMLKAKNLSRSRAIKALDHALQGRAGEALCEKFVEALGLKTLFAVFMGKVAAGKKKAAATTHEDMEHILSILSSLFSSLASDSPSRIRLIAKFVENDYEKVDRLSEVREELETRIARGFPQALADEMDEDEVYLEKLDNGLFALQLADYVAAWVCMEDDGARDHLLMLLSRRDKSLADVVAVLDEYRDNIGDLDENESGGGGEDPTGSAKGKGKEEDRPPTEGEERRAILDQLARYLESLAA